MKTRLIVLTVVFAQAAAVVADDAPHAAWHQNFNDARREARAANLPLLLHFYADWCGPCRQMERGVLNSPEVMRQLGTVVVGAKIDVDHQPDVAARYAVDNYPSDLLVAPDGKVLHRSGGYAQPVHYVRQIQTAAAGFSANRSAPEPDGTLRSAPTLGLRGFSPVALTCDREWKKGSDEFTWMHENVEYRFLDEEEQQLFQNDPLSYVPRFNGCDPVLLATEHRREPGSLLYGATHVNQMYFFLTAENRRLFLATPEAFTRGESVGLVEGAGRSRE